LFFFFQAEDGIRDGHVTGVQTCALPISLAGAALDVDVPPLVERRAGERQQESRTAEDEPPRGSMAPASDEQGPRAHESVDGDARDRKSVVEGKSGERRRRSRSKRRKRCV